MTTGLKTQKGEEDDYRAEDTKTYSEWKEKRRSKGEGKEKRHLFLFLFRIPWDFAIRCRRIPWLKKKKERKREKKKEDFSERLVPSDT